MSLFLWLRDDWLRYFRFHSSFSPFSALHRSSPPCADPHGLLKLRKVLNALASGQQWDMWMSWDFEVATSRSDSSELDESRSSWLIRPIWTFGLELVKKILFWIFVFCFSEAEFLGRYLFFVGVLCLRNQYCLTCNLFSNLYQGPGVRFACWGCGYTSALDSEKIHTQQSGTTKF